LDTNTFVQVAANLVNLVILAVVLSFLLYKPVRNFLRKRTDRIQGQIAEAADELAKAEELKLRYEAKLEEVQSERDEILSEANRIAAEKSQRLIAEARKEADAIKARAATTAELEWERAESEMRNAIIEVSSVMAEKFVTLAINKETHDRLFEEALVDLEGVKWRD